MYIPTLTSTIVAPVGILNIVDDIIPHITDIRANITDKHIVDLKLFEIFNALTVGNIINDDIKSVPNIFIPNTIVIDVRISNISLYIFVFIPNALQKSSSYVNATSLLYSKNTDMIITTDRAIDSIKSFLLIARMLPKRYEFISTFHPLFKDINSIARAIAPDDIIAIAESAKNPSFLPILFIIKDASTTIGIDTIIGDLFKIIANATEKKLT